VPFCAFPVRSPWPILNRGPSERSLCRIGGSVPHILACAIGGASACSARLSGGRGSGLDLHPALSNPLHLRDQRMRSPASDERRGNSCPELPGFHEDFAGSRLSEPEHDSLGFLDREHSVSGGGCGPPPGGSLPRKIVVLELCSPRDRDHLSLPLGGLRVLSSASAFG